MLATNLKEALSALDPDRALSTPELNQFYISRPNSPLNRLEVVLRDSKGAQKILFTGHRGSGKTTELKELSSHLEDEFFIFRYSVIDRLNLYDVTYIDVLLALGLELFEAASRQKLRLNDALYAQMLAFTREVSTALTTGSPISGELGGELNFLIAKLNAKLKIEDQTRKEVREKVSPRLSTLLETVDLVARSIQAETGKRILAIVEDLDKVDPATAKRLFFDHAASLAAPRLYIIYTFPVGLRHDNNFVQVRMSFPNPHVLPIFKIRNREGDANEHAIQTCEQILNRRTDPRLFGEFVTRTLSEACGGVPRLLLELAKQACLEAMVNKKAIIDSHSARAAITSVRRDYEVLLSKHQIATLKKVHRTKQVDNDEVHRELLHNLSCLEYWNDDVWYDVHPIVQSMLEA
jgi:energy-coupling factor transporter ATP-binding protein EcfA2